MKWSYKLGEWFGIPVRVHATFLLLLGWIAYETYSQSRSFQSVAFGVLSIVALFCFVVLHEYGHALTARHFGIRTLHITLYPIGGVASLQGMPSRPREQLLVALAGPAVNFALAGIIAVVMALMRQPIAVSQLAANLHSMLSVLLVANLALGSFNLLPALPMDGGRVFRALLAMRLGPRSATQVAAVVAKIVAVLMGGYALFTGQTMLAVIAVVVWLGSTAESQNARRIDREQDFGDWENKPIAPTEVLQTPLGSETDPSKDENVPGPSLRSAVRPGVEVGGVRVELVQTPAGPRMRYSRIR